MGRSADVQPPDADRDTIDDASRADGAPSVLTRLLSASDPAEEEAAWADFVARHSRILVHVCRTVARDRDAAMDGYAYVLEALRQDGCRRLRTYVPDPGTRFTTWLVVVSRRLLLDHLRRRYGRARGASESSRAERAARRRLEDLVAADVEPDALEAPGHDGPDDAIRREELAAALRRSLDELPPSDRLLLALRFEDGRSVREIASLLGLPTVFHVYRRLGAALDALRAALGRRGVSGPDP